MTRQDDQHQIRPTVLPVIPPGWSNPTVLVTTAVNG
jgi:hypothetical protein